MLMKIFDFLVVALATVSSAYVKEVIFQSTGTLAYSLSAFTGLSIFLALHSGGFFVRRVLKVDKRYRFVGNWMETMQKDGMRLIPLSQVSQYVV
jgi:hypothetical protein